MSMITFTTATAVHLTGLVSLAHAAAIESKCEEIFNKAHATRHMQRILDHGIAFIALQDDCVIGTITAAPIDAGFAMLADFETTHVFYRPECRSYVAIAGLFNYAASYARERGLSILFSQCDYRAAVAGHDGNSKRVEKLYKMLGLKGPVGIVYAAPSYARVGVTYLLEAEPASEADVAALKGVRRPKKPDE